MAADHTDAHLWPDSRVGKRESERASRQAGRQAGKQASKQEAWRANYFLERAGGQTNDQVCCQSAVSFSLRAPPPARKMMTSARSLARGGQKLKTTRLGSARLGSSPFGAEATLVGWPAPTFARGDWAGLDLARLCCVRAIRGQLRRRRKQMKCSFRAGEEILAHWPAARACGPRPNSCSWPAPQVVAVGRTTGGPPTGRTTRAP